MKLSIHDSIFVLHSKSRHRPIWPLLRVLALLLAIFATPVGTEIESWLRRAERTAGCLQLTAIPMLEGSRT